MYIKFVCLLLLCIGVNLVLQVQGGSHFCGTYTYYVNVPNGNERYTTCCGWWNRSQCTRYRTVYKSVPKTGNRCCDGYTGSRCDTSIGQMH